MVLGELKLKIKEKIAKKLCEDIMKLTNKTFIPLHEPSFDKTDIISVNKSLKSSYVSSFGPYTNEFQKKISEFTKCKYVICTNNGTSALHLALIICGILPNEEVLVPSLTFIATANAIRYNSSIPHFVDIEKKNLGIDPKKLEIYLKKNTITKGNKTINKLTGRVISAILPVHLFGHPSQIIELIKISKKYNFILIEDAAEALGSFYNLKHLGTFGKVGIISFNGNKIITSGGGGAILTNNKKIAERARFLSTTAKLNHPFKFIHSEVGYNYRMPNINAALGLSQITKLNKYLKNKRKLTLMYKKIFEKNEFFDFFSEPENSTSNYWLQTIIIKKKYTKHRDYILNYLNNNGIMCRPPWNKIHTLKPYRKFPRMRLDTTNDIYKRIINIPSGPNII